MDYETRYNHYLDIQSHAFLGLYLDFKIDDATTQVCQNANNRVASLDELNYAIEMMEELIIETERNIINNN